MISLPEISFSTDVAIVQKPYSNIPDTLILTSFKKNKDIINVRHLSKNKSFLLIRFINYLLNYKNTNRNAFLEKHHQLFIYSVKGKKK